MSTGESALNKLQFGSFYKFVVSVGVVLIIVPALVLHSFLTGSYDILISEQEYLALSQHSLNSLRYRKEFIDIFFSRPLCTFFIVCVFFIIPGVLCIFWGSHKWYKVQKELDDNISLDVQKKRFNVEELTLSANTERVLKKSGEDIILGDKTDSTESEQKTDTEPRTNYAVLDYIKVENACFKYLEAKLSGYEVQQGVKIGGRMCDIVAISKRDNADLIYEIKYWRKPPSSSVISETLSHLNQFGADYGKKVGLGIQVKLLIVSGKEQLNSIRKMIEKRVEFYPFVEVKYLSQDELYHNEEPRAISERQMVCSNNIKAMG